MMFFLILKPAWMMVRIFWEGALVTQAFSFQFSRAKVEWSPQVYSQRSEVAFQGLAASIPESSCCGSREPQSSTGMGSCWARGNGGKPGEELGGCRSPERSAEGAGPSTRVGEAWKLNGKTAVFGV